MRSARVQWIWIVALVAVCFPVTAQAAALIGTCGPYQQSAPGALCREPYIGGELIRLTTGVAAGSLRSAPASTAAVVATLAPSSYASMQIVPPPGPDDAPIAAWDGTQRWYRVHLYPLNRQTEGWIEQASFGPASALGYPPEDPATNAGWQAGRQVRVKPGFPFVWLRAAPSSDGPVIATVVPNDHLTLLGASTFDGRQWWWQVSHGSDTGWVEQAGVVVGASIGTIGASSGSLSYPPDDPAALAIWYPPLQMRVKPGIPFLWLRGDPASTGRVLATAYPRDRMALEGRSIFDGVQWWWEVSNGQLTGWVEQSHLVAIQP